MGTNRTIEILRTYNFAQKNHWQLMCDLSNNDYDICYFDGRQSANIYLDEFLQTQEDNFNIDWVLKCLTDNLEEYTESQAEYYKENNCYNEFLIGMVDEIELLIHIVKQDY